MTRPASSMPPEPARVIAVSPPSDIPIRTGGGRHSRLMSALMSAAGFCEYFNPIDGAGLGGANFSWTAAVWLMLA